MAVSPRYYRRDVGLFALLERIKLWPARSGYLHGIKTIEYQGEWAIITTHCGETVRTRNSRSSRAARWLRSKLIVAPCPKCAVPAWKIEKYSKTFFTQHYGSDLREHERQ